MAAPPSPKDILADEGKFNDMTEKAFNKAGGGATVDKKALKTAVEELQAEMGLNVTDEHKAKFHEAAVACGLSADGQVSLDQYRAEMRQIFTKMSS